MARLHVNRTAAGQPSRRQTQHPRWLKCLLLHTPDLNAQTLVNCLKLSLIRLSLTFDDSAQDAGPALLPTVAHCSVNQAPNHTETTPPPEESLALGNALPAKTVSRGRSPGESNGSVGNQLPPPWFIPPHGHRFCATPAKTAFQCARASPSAPFPASPRWREARAPPYYLPQPPFLPSADIFQDACA